VPDVFTRLQAALADRYTIERELGRGGMATVYLAEDRKHHRLVAIKVLKPELAAALGPERFLREIDTAARLNHPHILPLHDSGQAGGFLYYVMPYIEGESLRDRLEREGPLPLEEALRITREVASALSYAHSHDVVHRDIKPENILVSGGEAVVADFGVARAITQAAGTRLTETGIPVGTPAYMSPEQASGGGPLDGRSDVYSLACVLYEMLVGEPPYTGASAQVVIAKRFTDPVPSVRRLRETVPSAIDSAITRALAKAPVDRYATATNFGEALTPATPTPTMTARAWRGVLFGAAGAVLVIVAAGIGIRQFDSRRVLDDNLVAVAPFDVFDRKLELWREGLMDILSRDLDGAGPLRTLPPSIVMRRWRGRADAASAANLGRRTGARLAVFGTLVRSGTDSVRLAATLLDVGSGRALGEIELRDLETRVDRLADSATYSLLRALGREVPVARTRAVSLGSRSLPALKVFLRGEQQYRQDAWDSASAYYDQAVALDTTFALPLSRLAWMGQWGYGLGAESPLTYASRAAAFNHGLAPRESLFIVADSLFAALSEPPSNTATFKDLQRRLLSLLDQGTRRYPDDPEVWVARGEVQAHFGYYDGTGSQRASVWFDRAIALDSLYAEAYVHPATMALTREDRRAALRYVDGYVRATAEGPQRRGYMLAAELLRQPTDFHTLGHLLDTVPPAAAFWAWVGLRKWPDSTQMAIGLAQRADRYREFNPSLTRATPGFLYATLAFRGRVHEAVRLMVGQARGISDSELGQTPIALYLAEVGFMNALPREADEIVGRVLQRATGPHLDFLRPIVSWRGTRGDTLVLRRFVHWADSTLRHGTTAQRTAAYVLVSTSAYLALARHDTAEALRWFGTLPEPLCRNVCTLDPVARVRLLMATGDLRRAAQQLASDLPGAYELIFPRPSEVLWAFERGRVNERLGNREQSRAAYSFVADAWIHADPELQPYVAEANAALKRLGAEPRP